MMLATSQLPAPVADPGAVIALLRAGLANTLRPEAMGWLDAELDRQRNNVDERGMAIALGLAGRKVVRADLSLSATDLAAARNLPPGWQPDLWGADEAARAAVLLATYREGDQGFAARVDRLCATAEVTELVAYFKGSPSSRRQARLMRAHAEPRERPCVRHSKRSHATIRIRLIISTRLHGIRWS